MYLGPMKEHSKNINVLNILRCVFLKVPIPLAPFTNLLTTASPIHTHTPLLPIPTIIFTTPFWRIIHT